MAFVTLPWAPGAFAQAQDRIYRIGASVPVTTHVLGMVDGISEVMWEVLADKVGVADAVNVGGADTITDVQVEDAVLARYGW